MTLQQIAKIAGVSPATVSLVLNNKPGVSQTKRDEILELLQKYNYSPQRSTSNSTSKKLLFIKFLKNGLLVEENAGFITAILDSVETECRKSGYALRIVLSKNDLENVLKSINPSSTAGVFVLGTELDEEDYHLLNSITIPYIVIDNRVPFYNCNTITMSNNEMVYSAVAHLASQGFKEIAYFQSSMATQNFKDRADSFFRSCELLNLHCSAKHVFKVTATMMGAYADMKEYLSQMTGKLPPCAFADNDTIALGVMKALIEAGYSIPNDISIIGFDNILYSEINSPSLTTLQVNKKTIGEQAVRTLIKAIEDDSLTNCKQFIGGSIILRESTKN